MSGTRNWIEHVNPDYKSRLDPDVLLAMAKAALKKQIDGQEGAT